MSEYPPEYIPPPPVPEFKGSWERPGRSPASAAIFGLILIGIIYFYAQAIIATIVILIAQPGAHQQTTGKTFVEVMTSTMVAMKGPIRIALIISQFIFMLIPTIWIIRHWHTKDFLSYVRLKAVPLAEILLAIVATACFVPVSGFIGEFFLKQLNFPDFLARINEEIFTSYSPVEFIWVIIVVCMTPAICEETLFRGYVQRTLERQLGMKSLFIAGVIFGLYHMEPIGLVSLLIVGIMIGFFFYRSKSLLPGMAAHFTNNLIAILSTYRTTTGELRLPFLSRDVNALETIVALILTSGIIFAYYSYTKRNFTPQPA